jgi:hypothetical protein
MIHHKLLEKYEQTKPQTSSQSEIIKIRAEINDRKTKQTMQRINEAHRMGENLFQLLIL